MDTFKLYDISTPAFSLEGYNSNCRIVDIIDGDTIVIVLPLFSKFYKFHIRLNGIDTCELKSKDENLKKKALKARERVFELVCKNKCIENTRSYIQKYLKDNTVICWAKCSKFDKYGRLLADIYEDNNASTSVSYVLLEEDLAYAYDGGTKVQLGG